MSSKKLHEITQAFPSLKIAEIPAWVLYIEGIEDVSSVSPPTLTTPKKKPTPKLDTENPIQLSSCKTMGKEQIGEAGLYGGT